MMWEFYRDLYDLEKLRNNIWELLVVEVDGKFYIWLS